ncbi:MAG: carbohydrate binding domain-containing protein [Sedimentisphaerales bacterium]|nr:carbohydrate binding domain-containing protein [Sedimentisphaerales bacterium]
MRTRVIWLAAFFLIGFIISGQSHAQDEVENLLINGNFEGGVSDPWGTYGGATVEVVDKLDGAVVDEDPIEGNYCLHIVVPTAAANFWETGFNQGGLVFEAGKIYTLSVFLKSKEGTLDINFKPELAQDPWTAPAEQSFTMTEEWAEYTLTTGEISEDITPAEIVLHIGYAPGDFWIDNIRWYEGEYVAPSLGDKSFASSPVPEDGSLHPDTWANLSWKPGDKAVSHDVYFSDNYDLVRDGAAEAFQGNQGEGFVVVGFPGFAYPDGLVNGATYYWRIDEVNDTEPNSPWKGPVWSFSIPPKTGYNPDPADAAEQVYPETQLKWTAGFDAKLHTVYFGDNFDDVNNATGGQAQGDTDYDPGPLELAKTYYWRVDEFDIIETHKGPVWSFTTEGAVEALAPANGDVDVNRTQIITWSPNVFAASHEVYFGTDKDAVKNADSSSPEYKGTRTLGTETYDPGKLELGVTYYWRIDEVNSANPDSPWPGILWSFTTSDSLIVDDMESYNDLDEGQADSNRIYLAWVDGFDNPTVNGSIVGHANAPFAEQNIVHGGNQSMPFAYDNSVGKSEATLTLTYPRDWTADGVSTLSIWFRGDSANAAEPMYVALNDSAVVTNDNPDAAKAGSWTEWTIDLQAFADQGLNLTNVNTITLGFGNRNNPTAGGAGMVYFDDIRLYTPVP